VLHGPAAGGALLALAALVIGRSALALVNPFQPGQRPRNRGGAAWSSPGGFLLNGGLQLNLPHAGGTAVVLPDRAGLRLAAGTAPAGLAVGAATGLAGLELAVGGGVQRRSVLGPAPRWSPLGAAAGLRLCAAPLGRRCLLKAKAWLLLVRTHSAAVLALALLELVTPGGVWALKQLGIDAGDSPAGRLW